MDLIQSGAIFSYKPTNELMNTPNDDSISKFEELYMASPRAKELSSSVDLSSYTSSSSSFTQYHSSLFTPSKNTTSNDLAYSGFGSLSTPSTVNCDLSISPTLSDTKFSALKYQVNHVINSLSTPKSRVDSDKSLNKDSGLADTCIDGSMLKAVNKAIASGCENDHNDNRISIFDPTANGYDDNSSDGPFKSNICGYTMEKNKPNLQTFFSADEDEKITALDYNSDNLTCENTDHGNVEYDLFTSKTMQKKEHLLGMSAENMEVPEAKNAHHLSEWCIKAVITKNNPHFIIVEGQRPEDNKGFRWHSTAIVNRLDSRLLETKRKSCYVLEGEIEENMTCNQGFSAEFVEAFKNGFPPNWKELVEGHFASFLSSKKKNRESKKKMVKKHRTEKETKETTAIEVELKRTSSGRLIKPPLAWWRGQRIMTDGEHNLTAIEPGGEEHTPLSIGLYDFDLKLPEKKISILKSTMMTPKMAKFDLMIRHEKKTKKSVSRVHTKTTENNTKKIKKLLIKKSRNDDMSSDKTKPNTRFSRHIDDSETDTSDTDFITKVHFKNTRLQCRNQRKITTNRNAQSHTSRMKYVHSQLSKKDKDNVTTRDKEEARIESAKSDVSFDEETNGNNLYTGITKTQLEYDSSKDIHTIYNVYESMTSDDSNTMSYRERPRRGRKLLQIRSEEDITNQNAQQCKKRNLMKKEKQHHTETTHDKQELPYLRHRNKENIIRFEYDKSEQSSSSDEEAQAIASMLTKSKDRKDQREKEEQQEKESNSRKPKEITDDRPWKEDEMMRFTKSLHNIPINSAGFWERVATLVKTRTAQECNLKYEEQLQCKPRRQNTKTKQVKTSQKVVAITGGVGTVKRKRELQQLIQQTNDGYDDDIFDSTPYKKSKNNLKILVQSCNRDEDDDGSKSVDNQNNKEHRTPSSRTPSSHFRPQGPTSNFSTTPTAELISPSLLQPIDRDGMDYYINRVKQGRSGLVTSQKTKISTPKNVLSLAVPKVKFDIHEAPDCDSEEEIDNYFSDD